MHSPPESDRQYLIDLLKLILIIAQEKTPKH